MSVKTELQDGKYTIVNDNGVVTVLRYGEPWRDCSGDGAGARG